MLITAVTYAAIIVLESLGFIVWNVGSRAPHIVARDVVSGLRNNRVFRRNVPIFVFGGACLVGAYGLLIAWLPYETTVRLFVIALVVLAGLAVEMLVGGELRRTVRRPD
jgi:hypothetical protein